MKERRAPADSTLKAEITRLDSIIAERFKAERRPEASVDGDDRWEMDLYDIPDDELPGMWERADFMGGES